MNEAGVGARKSEKFVASNGWLDKFMKRYDLGFRRATTVCQKPPSEYIPKLVSFVMFIRKERIQRQYPYGCIYAADETAVWIDNPVLLLSKLVVLARYQ